MKHGVVHPEIPRYEWNELRNPATAVLSHIDEYGVENFEGRLKQKAEPPLEGPPANAKDSIFLSVPGLAEAHDLITHARSLPSSERRRLVDNTVTLMKDRPAFTEQLLT